MNEIPPPAAPDPGAYERLQGELEELRRKLAAAEGALQAARGGEPDVVAAGDDRGQSSSSTRDRLLANSIEETRQAFAAWRPDGSLILANRAARELLGYEEGEMHGLDWQRDLVPPDQRPAATVADGALRRGDRPAPFELELARKDGSRVPVRILVHAERDASGRIESYCMFWIEAIRCRDYEQALLASEAFYRPMFNHMFNGIAYCRMHFEQGKPVDWSYLEVNAAFEELVGQRWVVGKRASEAIPGLLERNPELLEIYGRVASTGNAERFETYVHALDMWCSSAAYCPRPGYVAAVFEVITERKRAEEALRRSEERFRSLFETMAHGVIYQDDRGRVIDANPAAERIFGLSREQLLNQDPQYRICSAIHLDGREFAVEDLPTTVALRTGTQVLDVMMGVFNPTISRTRWLSVNAMPLFEAGKAAPTKVYCTLRDVTEKIEAENALAASEARSRAYLDWAADATFVNDSQGRFLDVNEAACRSLGYTREELLRMNVSDVEQDITLETARQDWERLPLEQLRTFLGTQRRKDGSTFPVEVRFGGFKLDRQRCYVATARDLSERREAERRLEQRDELLRITSEIAMLGGWEFDALTGEGRWTEGVARIHDLDLCADISVERGLSFYTEECRPRIAQAFQDALTKGVPYDLELEIVTAQGVRKQVRTNGIPVVEDGRTVKVRGIVQDISERKRTEQSLRESQERLEAIVNTAVDSIITIDEHGLIDSFNPAAERIFGYRADEIMGQSISVLMPEPLRSEHSAYIDRYQDTGEAHILGKGRELVASRKDGSTFPIEIGVNVIHVQGRHLFVGILRDISERKRAEAALRRSEERHRRIVETAQEGVWVHDLEGRTTFTNSRMAEMLGCLRGELDGRRVADFLDPELRESFVGLSDRQRHGISETHDFRFRRKDGSQLWAMVSASPLRDDEGRVVGVLKMVTDVTERHWAQQELRASERKFRALARTIPGVVYQMRFRPDGTYYFSYLSPRITEVFDFDVPLDSPGWFLGSGIHPDDVERFLATVMKALATQTDWTFEGRCILRGGQVKWFQAISSLQTEGEVVAFNGVLLDVSERKAAEHEIRTLNASLEHRVAERTAEIESMVNHAAVGLAFFDRECRTLRVNVFLAGLSGIPVQDHIGRYPRDVYPPFAELVEANVPRVFATGEPLAFGEFSIATHPGEGVQTYLVNFFPVRLVDGSVSSVGVSVSDITPQKRVERELARLNLALNEEITERGRAEQQLRRLAAILESAPDFVAMADPELRIFYCNQAAIRAIGWEPGRDVFSIGETHTPEVGRFLQESALPTAVREGVWRGETDLLARDGRRIPVSQVILSHFNADGSLAHYSTIMRDMTEHRTLERDLRQHGDELARANLELARASRMKDEFLGNMSHELRTPLNGVLSMAQALEEEVYGPVNPDQAQAIQDILSSGRHLLAIISDILDLTRIEAGTLEYIPGELKVAATCQAAVRMIAQAARKKRHRIEITLDPAVGHVVTDERRLKQILVNLLSNAVKFTPEDGSIGLEVHGDADRRRLRLTIHDTGIGIAADDLGRIFDPFTQVDSSLSRQFSGAGLGLALVKQMAQLLGGDVTVESEPGQGSRFTLELDWEVPANSLQPDKPVSRARQEPPAQGDEILASPEAIADFLATLGMPTMIYPRDATPIERIVETRPRVVLIDAPTGDALVADLVSRLAVGSEPALQNPHLVLLCDDTPWEGLDLPVEVTWLRTPVLREALRSVLSRMNQSGSDEIAVVILAPDPPSGGRSNIVLLAEDDAINARSVLDFLQTQGLCLALAREGEEAVRKALELLPRAILMDVHLPGLDGLEAIRRIRSDRSTASIPIIALTALSAPGDRERCLAAGADAYVAKPFVLRELLGVLAQLLHGPDGERKRGPGVGLGQPDPHRG